METLDFNVEAGVGWIRLNRPEKRNPFDTRLRKDLLEVLEQIREDPAVRAVVLSGTPGAFCAGGNLNQLKENVHAGSAYWQQRLKSGLRSINDLLHLGRPLIAVVDGPAFGAGFALALTADMVLASPRARFAMSYLRLGLVPDLGALYLLPRIVGLQRAKELVLSTREIDAEEAHDLGIVMEVHDSQTIEARAREIALSMTKASPTAVALTKAALNASLDSDQSTMFTLEANSQPGAFATPEPLEAIDCLLSKRPTPFQWPALSREARRGRKA